MKKIYKYTIEEENEINHRLGYGSKELNHICSKKQYQYTIGISEILKCFKLCRYKKCEKCNSNLIFVKEFVYAGLRHPPNATGGDHEKTYEVVYRKYCPDCRAVIEQMSEK